MKRPFIYLAVALVVAAAVWLLERPEKPKLGDVQERPLVSLDPAKIQRVKIIHLINGVELRRTEKDWQVASLVTPMREEVLKKEGQLLPETVWHRADPERVKNALEIFTSLERGILVSTNPDKQGRYQVNKIGLQLLLYTDPEANPLQIYVGKNGPDYNSNYVRLEGEDQVYLVNRSLQGQFSSEPKDWRDRKIISLDPVSIISLEIWQPPASYHLVKGEDNIWKLKEPLESAVNEAKVQGMVAKLAQLFAEDFPETGETVDFEKPTRRFKLTTKLGETISLVLAGKNSRNQLYAQREGDSAVYLLSPDFAAATFPEKVDDLKAQ